ncbi:MAG: M15 family metallopeptidase [Candidatus Obscuribacterales bacterium]|nr:M15 family metallopeptidase [Candidatus Obscuribacterales bacterium]
MTKVIISDLPKQLEQKMIETGVWTSESPVPLSRLSLLKIAYRDFAGIEHNDGEFIVFDAVAKQVASIFIELYKNNFPIHKIKSVHHYSANDELSMADNNSSCFCVRPIEGTSFTSLHSYAMAIDLNPLQNPFVAFDEEQGTAQIHPAKGWEFLNRRNQKPGMVEDVVPLMAKHGFFIWGGSWTTPIDYHHFQPPRGVAELLTIMPKEDGELFFESVIVHRSKIATLSAMPHGEKLEPLVTLYKKNRNDFFQRWFEFV